MTAARVALKLDTLNIGSDADSAQTSPANALPPYDRLMTALPTPHSEPDSLSSCCSSNNSTTGSPLPRSLRSSGGKRTHDFFSSTSSVVSPPSSISSSTRPRTASNVSTNSNEGDTPALSAEPLSRLPSARAPKGSHPSTRARHAAAVAAGPFAPSSSSPRLPVPAESDYDFSAVPTSSSPPQQPSPLKTPTPGSHPFPRIPSPSAPQQTSPPTPPTASTSTSSSNRLRDPGQATKSGQILDGRFRILNLIGSGAFSKVVRAECIDRDNADAHQQMAIKMIHKATTKHNERMRLAVQRETEVLKHIRHPSLVRLFESFETPEHECLVLEYVAGGEMFDLLANRHADFTEPFVRRIFCGLVDVVKWMHSIHLVHRDIKLENVLLTTNPFPLPACIYDLPNPLVKLSDFGLSRFITPSAPMLRTRCGSEEYAAPELITGKDYDGRKTDAWALGVVLFTLLTGAMPFLWGETTFSPRSSTNSMSRRSYLMRIAKAEYHWPNPEQEEAELPFRIPDSAKRLVSKLLARDPARRVSLEDVWQHDEWLNGGPGKIETRDWAAQKDAIWVREGEQHPLLRTEVEGV